MKIDLPPDWQDLLRLFDTHRVRYLVVGGVAANYHGQPRFTQDVDLFIDRATDNAHAIKEALTSLGFGSLDISVEDLEKPNFVIMLGRPPNRVDLLTDIQPLNFAEAWARRVEVSLNGFLVHFISIEDLIEAKSAAGRPKDLADIAALKKTIK